jgi:DNA-binding transcriptional LysR family regulator
LTLLWQGATPSSGILMMVLRQLEYLAALARERHFGRAAEACHVSQPTLSAAIRLLEDDLGAPIVERGHRYVGLTPQGQVVLEHAHRILAEVENLRRGLEEIDKGLTGRLRIGVIPTALPVVSQLTGPFYARFPGVTVAVISMNSQEIDRGIEDFELEVGLTYLDAEPLGHVKAKPVCVEEYLFLTPANAALADRSQVTWREAAEVPLCLLTPDMQNRRIIDGVFRSVGAKPVPAVETNSIFNLVSHVSAGQWSAIVPRQLLRFFGVPEGTRAIELVEPIAQRTIGLVMSDREPPSPLARNLFAMQFPADISAQIQPPNRMGADQRKTSR